jgi:TATA-box binding protein (TBP) (component of TFIID and TFIIIB)
VGQPTIYLLPEPTNAISGNKGVQLVFKSGKRLLIGSQKAEELEEAIRSISCEQ